MSAVMSEYWAGRNYELSVLAPTVMRGKTRDQTLGLRREFQGCIYESKDCLTLDMSFSASLSDEGIIGGVVSAAIFWPIALGLGGISYYEYDKNAKAELAAFWAYAYDRVASMLRARAAQPEAGARVSGEVKMNDEKKNDDRKGEEKKFDSK
jgi:hypothetical protein